MSEAVERFAPSPTGRLHLGHAYSAMRAHDAARAAGGRFLLRIEDIDAARSREAFVDAIAADLAWLGLRWDAPPLRQSRRLDAYAAGLARLDGLGVVYPCVCTRREIAAALAAPQEGAPGAVYPGTCRGADPARLEAAGRPAAMRLDLDRALALCGDLAALSYEEIGDGAPRRVALSPEALRTEIGDVALGRKDAPASYHLAVVLDDAHQGVTHVTRGADLAAATGLHRLLQALLGLPTPVYRHHRLIRDAAGRRLAKRDDARALAALREADWTPQDVRRAVGL